MTARRFPPPWTVEDIGAAFVVEHSAGQELARAGASSDQQPSCSAKNEARRIAANIAKLVELIGRRSN